MGAAALLAGCAHIPEPEDTRDSLPELPATWTAAESLASDLAVDWLADFDDPRLTALTAEALRYNTNLAQVTARLDAARASARSASAAFWPWIDASGDARRNRSVVNRPVGVDNAYNSTLSTSLNATWEVDVWGRIRNQSGAAYADARAARADLEGARLSLAGSTARAWFALIEARLQTELAARDVDNRGRTLELIERRFARGLNGSLDVRLARSDLASRKASLQQRIQVEREAARALEVLLGRYPDASIGHDQALPALPPLTGAGLPAEILARRPDLQAAEERLTAAGLRARDARKALLPRLTVTGSLTTSNNSIATLFDIEEMAGNLIAGLVQPVFRGGRLIADAQAARARAVDSLYGYLDAALIAFRDVENALSAETLLAAREEALIASFENALAAERLTERDYRAGLTTIFNLLDSQSRRISAESALIAIQRERLSNRVGLHLAIGGPFSTGDRVPARHTETLTLTPGEGLRP